ncbi:unnamed protein product [Arabidopsis thaliana]|uniref:(thale cress) hypothetical protein n=1 Tax=Arabidopsis thaliana TaxID=3702 RepID=A0A7G2EAK9_ARATH|nr:unnamed protein product [Arabidopsis thaliana]
MPTEKGKICPHSALSTNQNGLASCLINHRPSIMKAFANRCGLSSPNAAPLYCSIIWTLYKCGSLWNGFTAIKMFPVAKRQSRLWSTPGSWRKICESYCKGPCDYFGIGAFDFSHFSTDPCEFWILDPDM